MPIRINLLAEMQALEEIRRRDPVKRAVIIGVGLVALTLVWCTSLMLKKISAKSELANLEAQISSGSKTYKQVLDNQQSLVEGHQKLTALHQLATNRFLMGNMLDALQNCSVDNVQLTRFKIDQSYVLTEGTKSTTNAETGVVSSGKPASTAEKTSLTVNARDTSAVPGDSISRFQTTLSHNSFFHSILGKSSDFRLTTSLTPQMDAEGKTFVAFTLEARLPDKTR
jgi:hypothetical protein